MSTQSIEELKQDLEETRARIDRNVSVLGEEAKPSKFLGNILNNPEKAPEDMVDFAIHKIREHPIAASLVVAGIAGLLAKDRVPYVREKREEKDASIPLADPLDRLVARKQMVEAELEKRKSDIADAVNAGVSKMKDGAKKAETATKRSIEDLQTAASDLSVVAQDKVETVSQETRKLAHEGAQWVQENPLKATLAATALGAIVASFLVPKKTKNAIAEKTRDRTSELLAQREKENPKTQQTPMGAGQSTRNGNAFRINGDRGEANQRDESAATKQ